MFTLPYLYYYLLASFFTFMLERAYRNGTLRGELTPYYLPALFSVCHIAEIVFLILGFWFMPHWWYPLVFLALSFLTNFIPIPDKTAAIIGHVLAPLFVVLMYLNLFGIL